MPRIPNQNSLDAEMRKLFQAYHVEAASKLVPHHYTKDGTPGSHCYCFVDLSTALEAVETIEALNGKKNPYGAQYIVQLLHCHPGATTKVEREQLNATSRIWLGRLTYYQDQASLETAVRQMLSHHEIASITRLFKPSAAKIEAGVDRSGIRSALLFRRHAYTGGCAKCCRQSQWPAHAVWRDVHNLYGDSCSFIKDKTRRPEWRYW